MTSKTDKNRFFSKGSVLSGCTAIVIVATTYWLSQPHNLSDREYRALAAGFAFDRETLPIVSEKKPQRIRNVHPSLKHLAAWTSFVGGAVSVGDLDGDGFANDIAYVDTRFDEVTICPALKADHRYAPFILKMVGVSFDSETVAPMGSRFGDFNEDGRLDILVYFWGRSPLLFLQSVPTENAANAEASPILSSAKFIATDLVSPHQVWHTSCVTQADFDGDGHIDLLIGNYNPDGAKTLDSSDVIGNEVMMGSWGRATNGGTSRILLRQAAGTNGILFAEAKNIFPEKAARGWTLGAGAADLDGDLLPELYLVHDFGADTMLHNRSKNGCLEFASLRGRRSLTTPRSMVIGLDSFNGMGVDFADLDGDGKLDFMVSNITSDWGLHQSSFTFMRNGDDALMQKGIAPFDNHSEELGLSRGGWAWDVKFGDLNNDGELEVLHATGYLKGKVDRWPEMHEMALGNEELARFPQIYPRLREDDDIAGHEHNRFFTKSGKRYYDIGPWLHESHLDEPDLSRGIAMADVDGDGLLDFAYGNQWEDSYFYHNKSKQTNDFIGLHIRLPLDGVVDPESIRVLPGLRRDDVRSIAAIGAQVRVHVEKSASSRSWVTQVDGGNGHSGQRSSDVQFGLGSIGKQTIAIHFKWRDRSGTIREANANDLSPGWYTIYLGS